MDPKKSINEEGPGRDITKYKSELEDIDFAVFKFVDEGLDIHTNSNKGFRKVPIIWSGSERAHNIKNTEINRDAAGMVTLPVISIERDSMKKTEKSRVIPYAKLDPHGDVRGGSFIINRIIKQDKTSNFANADAHYRKKQQNFPLYRLKQNKKIVYETLTIPIPIYLDVGYKIVLTTEYQEQMNDMVTPFVRISNAHKRINIGHNLNKYEAWIQEDYVVANNISKYETNERRYETTITVNVFGYLIGDTKNQKKPRVVRRENAVQIRFARERVIVQDEDGEFRF
tara:strand:- start:87 stop:938 length:852 start_codon:yes stop_codon:yes gene_type:complete